MKSSVSSYSFEQYTLSGKMKLTEICAKARSMGFDAIEFIGMPEDSDQIAMAKEIKKSADDAGMKIIAYTIGAEMYYNEKSEWDKQFDRMKGQIEIANILGAPLMRHDVCYSLKARSFDLMLPQIAENTRTVTEYAAAHGVKTCTENHGRIAQDSDRMERLFNAVNHENYGLLLDFGNFTGVDEVPAIAVSRLAPYAFHVHAKDASHYPDNPSTECFGHTRGFIRKEATYVGGGDVDVFRCLKIMDAAGYDGYVSIEFEGLMDCIEGIRMGKENLDRYISIIEESKK